MMISTISIAEYCVGGDIHELPLKNLQIVPFNLDHSKRTGEFAKIVFQNKAKLKLNERNIIPNDTKLFAQADCEKSVEFYLSSDTESLKIYNLLKEHTNPKFQFIDLNKPYNETFGVVDFGYKGTTAQQGFCLRRAEVLNSSVVFQLAFSNNINFCAPKPARTQSWKPFEAYLQD